MTRSRKHWSVSRKYWSVFLPATLAALLWFGFACLAGGSARAAEDEADEGPLGMIVELLGDEEPEMRGVALGEIRDSVPGEAATLKFAELLPSLPAKVQAELLVALGDRGDATARPSVLKMLTSQTAPVRVAALSALGALGDASDVALLAEKATTGSKAETTAARQSLVKLRGEKVNATIVAEIGRNEPKVRAELLGVLAARNAKETLPTVIESAKDSETAVRLAALGALRFLADESHTATIVDSVKAAKDYAERAKAKLALLAVCSRAGEASAEAIIAGLAGADVPSRIALLDALARAGGQKALDEIVARLKDEDPSVCDQAVRMLCNWGDLAAVNQLLTIAETGASLRHRVLAIRGLVRLASPRKDQPADLETLAAVMSLAKRTEEKRLVLGALGGAASQESLDLVTPILEDPELAQEASLAVVKIAQRIEGGNEQKIRPAFEKAIRIANLKTLEKVTLIGNLKTLTQVMGLAKRPEEKRLVLRALGLIASEQSLALVVPSLADPALAKEAGLAVVRIAEKIKGGDKEKLRAAVEKVAQAAEDPQIRDRAREALESL